VLFTVILVYIWNLKGALIAAVTYQSIVFLFTLWFSRKTSWFDKNIILQKFSRKILLGYLHYSLMTFVAVTMLPLSQLLLRRYVISYISIIEAGWWEAMNRISGIYLMVITSSFGVYYGPRLSELKDRNELKKEIFLAYKIIIPCLLIGLTCVYFLRYFIIKILFSPDFLPMEDLFIYQLLGDFFKISSWLLAFIMGAKRMTKEFISTEIIFSLLFVGLAFMFLKMNGIVGIVQGYFLNYIIYFMMMLIMFRKLLFFKG
jgi:PST family polysaccharide transporter